MLRDLSGDRDWALVRLDEPFEWQLKVREPYQFRILDIDHFLIKSRWSDHSIGDAQPTSVLSFWLRKALCLKTMPSTSANTCMWRGAHVTQSEYLAAESEESLDPPVR